MASAGYLAIDIPITGAIGSTSRPNGTDAHSAQHLRLHSIFICVQTTAPRPCQRVLYSSHARVQHGCNMSLKHIRLTQGVGNTVQVQQTSCASALEGWSEQNITSSRWCRQGPQSCANLFAAEANILSEVFTLNTERGGPLGNHVSQIFQDS